jgi:hypothetical protein
VNHQEVLLSYEIEKTLSDLRATSHKYLEHIRYSYGGSVAALEEEIERQVSNDNIGRTITWYASRLYRCILVLAERCSGPVYAAEVNKWWKENEGKMFSTSLTEDDELYLDKVEELAGLFYPLKTVVLGTEVTGLSVLKTILNNTAKIVTKGKLQPDRETQVQKEVYDVISLAFSDAVRDPPFPKHFKTYKGDIGIPSLFAAIEYKFAKTKDEAKGILGGLFEDMKGYAGHPDYHSFFAVVYLKGSFYTQQEADAEFTLTQSDANWVPIVVNGP